MSKQKNLKDQVYYAILEGIFTDEYKPNQIINEQELVQKYGYSKSPIREALLMLCNEGILRSFPRFGYQVVGLTKQDVQNIMEFRLYLESQMLKNHYKSITPAQIQQLEEIDSQCKENAETIWGHWEANTQFHIALCSFAGNEYATTQLQRALDILKRAYAQLHWQKWIDYTPSKDIRQHDHIIQALKKQDIAQAVAHLEEDLKDFYI